MGIKKIWTQFYGVILSKQANTYTVSKQALVVEKVDKIVNGHDGW